MTALRTAAQQALTILEAWKHKGMWGDWDGVTDALKAALVEDAMQKFTDVSQEIEAALAEPVQPYDQTSLELCDTCGWRTLIPGDACLNCARLQKQEPVQEPVAWRFEARHIDSAWAAAVTLNHPGAEGVYMRNVTPLYAAPQRKPLTDQAIWREYQGLWPFHPAETPALANDILKFARAIERAHGITS